jgi:hypothetical protein
MSGQWLPAPLQRVVVPARTWAEQRAPLRVRRPVMWAELRALAEVPWRARLW